MGQPALDFDNPDPLPERAAPSARRRRARRPPPPVAVSEPPPVDPTMPFEDQEHLRQGAGTFEAPYVFRSPDEYWIVTASDPRTGRHAAARFNADPGDYTAHGHRERVQELEDMMGMTGYTGREKAVALAERWKTIHREVRGPARTPKPRPRRWPYVPEEHAAGAPIRFEADGEHLTGQIWGTSRRARHRYAITDDQRLFHVHLDTLTGQQINPGTDLNTPVSEATPAAASEEPTPAPEAAAAAPPAPPPDPLADEVRPGSNYEAVLRVEQLLSGDQFDLARAYARREATDPIIGPDLGAIQRLHNRLDPVESLQALVDREASEIYTLARRGGAPTDDQRRTRRQQAHDEHVSWLLHVLPPDSVHHARARRLEAELRAEEHTHINDRIRALGQTPEAEREPIRDELLDDLHALAHTEPAQDVVALLDRANSNDPAAAGTRESLRAWLALPTADEAAFADVLVIDHDTRTWHLPPTTPDSVREVLHEHGFASTYSRTDPWLTLTEDLGIDAMRERMGRLYTALGQLPDAAPRASAGLWRSRLSVALEEPETERRARMEQAQEQARERIGELVGQGELRQALDVVHDHIAELRANAFLPGVIERRPEFEDLYLGVYAEAERRKELLDAEMATLPDDAETLEGMAEEYRRQCPHLEEKAIAEAVGLAAPRISPTGSLDREEPLVTEPNEQTDTAPLEPPRTLTEAELAELRPYLRKAITGRSVARTPHGQRISLEGVSDRTKKELLEKREWMHTGPDEHLYLTEEGERVREAVSQMSRSASMPPPAEPSTTASERGEAAVADDDTLFPELQVTPSEPAAADDAAPSPEEPGQQDTAPAPADSVDRAAEEGPGQPDEALALLAGWEDLDEQTRIERRTDFLDEVYHHSRTLPSEETAALIDRANALDPEGAHVRESLRSGLASPAPTDAAFADVMVFDRNTRTWHVTPTTPDSVREVLQQHGFSGSYSHTDPWLTLTRDVEDPALDRILSQVYTELGGIPDAPARMVRTRWRQEAVRDAPGTAQERKERLQADHEAARERIADLAGAGDLRGAFAAMHDHHAELRRGGFLPGPVERDPDFPDLYTDVLQQAQSRKDALDGELADTPPQSVEERQRRAEEYRRQCPHLSEQAVLETVGLTDAQDERASAEVAAADGGAPAEEEAAAPTATSATEPAPAETDQSPTPVPDAAPPAAEAAEEGSAAAAPLPEPEPELQEETGAPAAEPDADEIPPEWQAMADADELPEEDFASLDEDPRPTTSEETPPPAQEAPAPAAADAPEEAGGGSSAASPPSDQDAAAVPDAPENGLVAADPGGDADEAARVAASFGNDPDRRPTAQIDLGEDVSDGDNQQPGRSVEVVLGETGTPAPAAEAAGPQRDGRVDQLPDHGVAPDPRTVDGRAIRANHRQWQSTWEKQGRAEAIKATEDGVYATMREQFRAALRQDQDVRLVMPSNDPDRVAEFIAMAEQAGFEITLSARIHPAPVRRMQGLGQLAEHFQQQKVERAALPDELRTEYDNLKTILKDAYENRSVHRIDLYPHDDNKAASSHRRVGDLNPDGTWGETTWSKHSHIKDEIHKLEKATISPTQRQWINKETMRIHQELPPFEQTHGLYRQMHAAITDTIDHLRSKQGLAQLNPDRARNVDVRAADAPARPEHSEPGPEPHDPGPEPHPDDRGEHSGVPEPRREPTGDPAPQESAPAEEATRRRRRVDAARVDGHVNTGPVETHAAAAPAHARQPVRGRTAG